MSSIFSRRYSGPSDQAFAAGRMPGDNNQLGPKQSQAAVSPKFAAEFAKSLPKKFNPGAENLWDSDVFSNDSAQEQQKAIDVKSTTDAPSFKEPLNNALALDFLTKYRGAVDRGLIEPERAVFSGSLARLATQPSAAGSTERDPNTVNKFPGAGGTQIG